MACFLFSLDGYFKRHPGQCCRLARHGLCRLVQHRQLESRGHSGFGYSRQHQQCSNAKPRDHQRTGRGIRYCDTWKHRWPERHVERHQRRPHRERDNLSMSACWARARSTFPAACIVSATSLGSVADSANSSGTITVSGAGTQFNPGQQLYVAADVNTLGQVTIQNGASISTLQTILGISRPPLTAHSLSRTDHPPALAR